MTAVYRLRQGLRALFAFAQPVDEALAAGYLSPPLLALFQRLRRGERLHALNVLRAVLMQADETPPDLAAAALLHDVGKSRYPLRLWQKTAPVLVNAASHRLYERLSSGDPRYVWVRPFAVKAHHPAWGAAMARRAGAPERVIWLIEQHQSDAGAWRDHPDYPLLKRLQQADDEN